MTKGFSNHQEGDTMVDRLRAISEGREPRLAHIYKETKAAADRIEQLEQALREERERCAKVCEARAVRSHNARGGMGQILAQTQDNEANECAAAIRALPDKP